MNEKDKYFIYLVGGTPKNRWGNKEYVLGDTEIDVDLLAGYLGAIDIFTGSFGLCMRRIYVRENGDKLEIAFSRPEEGGKIPSVGILMSRYPTDSTDVQSFLQELVVVLTNAAAYKDDLNEKFEEWEQRRKVGNHITDLNPARVNKTSIDWNLTELFGEDLGSLDGAVDSLNSAIKETFKEGNPKEIRVQATYKGRPYEIGISSNKTYDVYKIQ